MHKIGISREARKLMTRGQRMWWWFYNRGIIVTFGENKAKDGKSLIFTLRTKRRCALAFSSFYRERRKFRIMIFRVPNFHISLSLHRFWVCFYIREELTNA